MSNVDSVVAPPTLERIATLTPTDKKHSLIVLFVNPALVFMKAFEFASIYVSIHGCANDIGKIITTEALYSVEGDSYTSIGAISCRMKAQKKKSRDREPRRPTKEWIKPFKAQSTCRLRSTEGLAGSIPVCSRSKWALVDIGPWTEWYIGTREVNHNIILPRQFILPNCAEYGVILESLQNQFQIYRPSHLGTCHFPVDTAAPVHVAPYFY